MYQLLIIQPAKADKSKTTVSVILTSEHWVQSESAEREMIPWIHLKMMEYEGLL